MNDDASFGSWVRQRRKALDLTQFVLANRVGCAVVTIKKIEQDERRSSREMAERLAEILLFTKVEREEFVQVALQEKSPIRLMPPSEHALLANVIKPVAFLPAYATPIIGRKKEINTTVHLLCHDNRLVTLTGTGGVGKTRLAVAVGWAILPKFKHGVVFVPLAATTDPASVEELVAQELGVKQRNGRTLMEELIEFVSQRQLLIILDNFEHLLPAASGIAELLTRAAGLRILVTSRVELNLSMERILPIKPLSLPKLLPGGNRRSELTRITRSDAVRLFLERAQAHAPDFLISRQNATDVAEICKRLDGLPLAIELVAARVGQLSLPNIMQRLGERLNLAAHAFSDLPMRQQALRATFKWSYDLLFPAEKDLFSRLGVFSGGFTYEMAEAVCEKPLNADFPGVLSGLIKNNLVVCSPGGRYSMLETIREYALEKLVVSGSFESVQTAHLDYFLGLCQQAEHELWVHEDEWTPRLALEINNLEQALTWTLKRREARVEDVVKGGEIVGRIWYFWLLTGRLRASQRWIDLALQQIATPGPVHASLLLAKGVSYWQLGELTKSEIEMKKVTTLFASLKDIPGMAITLHMQGHIVFDNQRYAEAGRLFHESMIAYDALGDQAMVAILINDLGLVAFHQNKIAQAKKYYQESLTLFEQQKMLGYIGQSYIRLGDLARMEGDYPYAGELYTRALNINQEIQSLMEIASSLHKLSYIALHGGDIEQARQLLRQSLTIQWECGNQQGIVECISALASIAVSQGDDLHAARYFGAAKAILEHTGLPISPVDLSEWQKDELIAKDRCILDQYEQEYSYGQSENIEALVEEILSMK